MKMTSIKYSVFETEQIDFIVFNSPNQNDPISIVELDKLVHSHNICVIFRLCEPLYDSVRIINYCQIIDMPITDGGFPNDNVINDFLSHIQNIIKNNNYPQTDKKLSIGIHCRAGLGRAPIFAAIGIMNYSKYGDYSDVVKLIRNQIKGAINIVQLTALSKYKPKKKQNSCIIS
jgi:protein tyrosine phosphatase type 4A